jgi:hypothetical protein
VQNGVTQIPSDIPTVDGSIAEAARTLWTFHARSDSHESLQALVCLGSYDLRVAHRTAELALEHPDAQLVVTGAHGNWTRGVFDATEAEVFAETLVSRGVPAARILMEPRATNIGENVAFTRDLLGYVGGETVVFVTKPQTQGRVRATVPVHWPQIDARITAPKLRLEDYATEDQGLGPIITEMVGDLQRMIDYPQAGFQVPVEVPREVIEAFERLREAGYTSHCLPT